MKPIAMFWVAIELAALQLLQVDSSNTMSVELQSTSKYIGSHDSR